MARSLRGPTAATFVSNLLILLSSILAGVISARALGPAGRGQLAIVALWSGLIHIVGSLGLQSSCSYHLARWPRCHAVLAAWFTRIAVLQAIAMTVVSAAVLWWLRVRLGLSTPLTIEYMSWAAAGTFALYGATYAQGSFRFGRFNVIRLISGAMPTALILACALAVRLTPAEAGAAYLVPTWCSAVLAGIWLRRASRGIRGDPLSPRELRSLWSYAWRSAASLSSLTVNNSADQFALGLLVPPSSLGLYSVSASAASPLPSLIASLGMVGMPTVTALTGRAKARATWRMLRRATILVAVLAPPAAVLLPWAIPWLYGARYRAAILPAEVLLAGVSFAALTTAVDALLRAYGLPGFVSVTQGVGGIVTITGTVLVGGRPLALVAIASSVGFIVTFALALGRLWAATRRPRSVASAADRQSRHWHLARIPYRPVHARPKGPVISSIRSPGNSLWQPGYLFAR